MSDDETLTTILKHSNEKFVIYANYILKILIQCSEDKILKYLFGIEILADKRRSNKMQQRYLNFFSKIRIFFFLNINMYVQNCFKFIFDIMIVFTKVKYFYLFVLSHIVLFVPHFKLK